MDREERVREATKATAIGSAVNLGLSIGKIAIGILGRSSALLADGVHSFSDLVTDLALFIGFRIVKHPQDRNHDYGHGKVETLLAGIIGLFLMGVASGIFVASMTGLFAVIRGDQLPIPSILAFGAAAVSIVAKEALYQYTMRVGRRINSKALMANAWHHRSDALSSIATLLGIGGAIILGGKWAVLDPLAAIGVSVLIAWMSWKLIRESVYELLEGSLDSKTKNRIEEIIRNKKGVMDMHKLRTRRIGGSIAVDVHVQVDPDLDVVRSHEIATSVERGLRSELGSETFVSVHIEPYDICCEDPEVLDETMYHNEKI